MHVVMVSDLETQGGAGIGTSRLADGLIDHGVRITRLVHRPDGQRHRWDTYPLGGGWLARLIWEMVRRLSGNVSLRPTMCAQALWVHRRLRRALRRLRPDVISVHNIHGAGWWPELVAVCAQYAPTVWTLRDMWSFTGRCAYNYDCRRFVSGCDAACPTPDEYPALAPRFIAASWEARRQVLGRCRDLVAVCPSSWLAQEASAGLWKGHRVEVIPNGLPLTTYQPVDRDRARAALGLDRSAVVLLVAAQNVRERRKGGEIVTEALRRVAHRPYTVLTMGHGHLDVGANVLVHRLGYVEDDETKVLAYNAADLLVHPALVDNLPHVVMEAIACGTPVVSFAVGGLPDLVRPGLTGWLAESVNPASLAATVDAAIAELASGRTLQATCRSVAEAEYDSALQSRRYLMLFQTFVSKDAREELSWNLTAMPAR